MKLRCTDCAHEFVPEDEARCPKCLKTSTLEPTTRRKKKKSTNASLFRGPGLIVTLLILLPVMVLLRPSMPLTFVTAMVAFGAGHAVNYLWARR